MDGNEIYSHSLMHDQFPGFQYPSAHWSHLPPVYPSVHSHWPLSCRTEVKIMKYWNVLSYRTKWRLQNTRKYCLRKTELNILSYRTKVKTEITAVWSRATRNIGKFKHKNFDNFSGRSKWPGNADKFCPVGQGEPFQICRTTQQPTYNITHSSNSSRRVTVTRHTAVNREGSRAVVALFTLLTRVTNRVISAVETDPRLRVTGIRVKITETSHTASKFSPQGRVCGVTRCTDPTV